MKVVAVIGTGTGVGKTHVSCALTRALTARGLATAGRKPIESGVVDIPSTDAAMLAGSGSIPPASPPPYTFRDPVSPHLAARREGLAIEVEVAVRWSRDSSPGADLVVVETAGALLSPLGPHLTNLDLALTLAPDAFVLVAPDRLGVLHEVGCARRILPAAVWARTLVVLSEPAERDASSGTNADELRWLGWADDAVTWPRGARDGSALAEAVLALTAT